MNNIPKEIFKMGLRITEKCHNTGNLNHVHIPV